MTPAAASEDPEIQTAEANEGSGGRGFNARRSGCESCLPGGAEVRSRG